jgi:hypothetical protein
LRAVIRNSHDLSAFVTKVLPKLDGKPYTITIRRFHRPRTHDQNAKLHAMLRDLADHTGYSEGELKDVIKGEFLPAKTMQVGSHVYDVPKSTTELTVSEMGDLIERLYQLGHDVGCAFQGDES